MAGSRIKGITIEIDGSTTKLQDALKRVNSTIRDTSSRLRDVDRLLKLNPGNVELLQQKQKLLADAVNDTSKKLRMEKDALEQLKGGPQTEETIRQQEDLTREIIATEGSLEGLKKQYKDFGSVAEQQAKIAADKMKKCGEEITRAGEKISKVGSGLTKGVTVPIVGAATASVAAWSEVDEAMDTIVTKTGATGDALQDMQDRAQRIAQDIPTSFQAAADAVGEVNTRFGLTGDALEELSAQFVKFSNLNGTDVSKSIDLVQSALAAFGLSADHAGEMLDVLNKAGQDTGVSVDTLAGLMTTNAATLKEMGYSASDSAMLLANLSKNGVDASAAMTGLKKAYSESLKEGTPMNEMLSDLEVRLQNSDTYADAAAEAIGLFGARAGGSLVDAIANGRMSFDQLNTSMSDFAGNVGTTFAETLDPLDQMTMTMNTLKSVGADLINTAGPMLTDVMQGLADVVHTAADAWNGLDEKQQQMIIKCAGIAAVAGPVIAIGGKAVSGIGSLVSAGSGLLTTFTGIGLKLGGLAQGAGAAVNSMSGLGSAAAGAAAPVSAAGGAVGTLSQNALGLVAAGAGIMLASAGIALLAQSAIQIVDSGPAAAAALVVMIAAVAGMAVGAAALAPALTAGAAGLVAFGAGLTLVGAGIFLATSGVALLAAQLPNVAVHGTSAAAAIVQIGSALTVLAAGAALTTAAVASMLVPFAGAAVTIGATNLTLVGFAATLGISAAGAAALGAALLAVSAPVESIAKNAQAAGDQIAGMVTSVNMVESALSGLGSLTSQAVAGFTKAVMDGQPKAVEAAKLLTDTVMQSIFLSAYAGMTMINAEANTQLYRLHTNTRSLMAQVEVTMQASINRIKQMFASTELSFNQKIKLPHFSMSGRFDAESGSVPHVSVSWYRKAYDEAYLLNGATIFGAMNGRLLGGGEGPGSELVVGTDKLLGMIREAVGPPSFTQNLTINAPKDPSPSETARLTRNANRQMVLALRGI